MKRYSPTAPCPKCGLVNRIVEWIPATQYLKERLSVRCRHCGFSDQFLPIDAPRTVEETEQLKLEQERYRQFYQSYAGAPPLKEGAR